MKSDYNKKISTICNVITILAGITALILQVKGGASLNEPFDWILILLVITSFIDLMNKLKNK